jgi:polyhydroxybutyrate depolymerase
VSLLAWRRWLPLVLVSVALVVLISGSDSPELGLAGGSVSIAAATVLDEGYGTVSDVVTFASLSNGNPGVVLSAVGMRFGGRARASLVIAPAHPSPGLPILLVLSGAGASPTFEASRDELIPLVTAGKAILVYPAQLNKGWNIGADDCCGIAATEGVDDVSFVLAALAQVRKQFALDPAQVDLVGYSNGGKLAFAMLCSHPGVFDALAVAAAVPVQACTNAVQPPLSALFMVGAKDGELPISGHSVAASTALSDAVTTWRTRDDCPAKSVTTLAGTATVLTWTGCSAGTVVRSVLNSKLDHAWPQASLAGTAASGLTLISSFLGLAP